MEKQALLDFALMAVLFSFGIFVGKIYFHDAPAQNACNQFILDKFLNIENQTEVRCLAACTGRMTLPFGGYEVDVDNASEVYQLKKQLEAQND